MLTDLFKTLEFSDREERIYLAIASLGSTTASLVAKRVKIPRATVYLTLSQLIEKGVVSQEHTRGVTKYCTNKPSSFKRFVSIQKEKLEEKEIAATELSKALENLMPQKKGVSSQIQIYDSKANIESMLYDLLPEWRKSMKENNDMTLWGYQDNDVVSIYKKWHDHLWETMIPGEKIRLFSNQSDVEKALKHKIKGREIKPLPEGTEFSSSIWLYGDYIVMGMTRERPYFAIMIKDTLLANNLRAIFKLLWRAKW